MTRAADPAVRYGPTAGACGRIRCLPSGECRETAQPFKNRCSNEDGLVAEQRPSERIYASNQTFPQEDRGAPIVEATVERTAQDRIVPCGLFQCLQVLRTQLRIRVVKAQ